MTRVLPEPAPARINNGPSLEVTASRCCGLSCERNSVIKMFAPTFKHTDQFAQTLRLAWYGLILPLCIFAAWLPCASLHLDAVSFTRRAQSRKEKTAR